MKLECGVHSGQFSKIEPEQEPPSDSQEEITQYKQILVANAHEKSLSIICGNCSKLLGKLQHFILVSEGH